MLLGRGRMRGGDGDDIEEAMDREERQHPVTVEYLQALMTLNRVSA